VDRYGQDLGSFRFWNRVRVSVLFALLPVLVFVVLLARGSAEFTTLSYVLVLMWLLALGATLYRIRTLSCPRCGKTFSIEGWWSPRTRGRRCVHCSLDLDSGV
jgi:hypothetical protein